MTSLYIHIPFCAKKCLFCSFAISVGAGHRADDYVDALRQELRAHERRSIDTVYVGGGTPTSLNAAQLQRIVDGVKKIFDVEDNGSWSVEANPEGLGPNQARALNTMGFERVSIGVQSFNDAYLKFLGRVHTAAQARAAYGHVRDAGIKDVNIDLMYGFPGQTREELRADIDAVIGLSPEHVSIYTLTVEPNSRFHAKAVALDDPQKLADDYIFVTQALEDGGLKQYEVSNFAREGFRSRHNMAYWRGDDYIGIGMGAHGLEGNRRYWNEDTLAKYIDAVKAKGRAVAGEELLSPQVRLTEDLIFGLRMNDGVGLEGLERRHGVVFSDHQRGVLNRFIIQGLLEYDRGFIRATKDGRLVLDEISVNLV